MSLLDVSPPPTTPWVPDGPAPAPTDRTSERIDAVKGSAADVTVPAAMTLPPPGAPARPQSTSWKGRAAARCLRLSGALSVLRAGRRLRSVCVPILGYHRVWDLTTEAAFDYDINLISADSAAFRQQMRFLVRNYDPIRLCDLMLAIEEGLALPPRPVVITFDDGFEDNYTHAFPILREFGMPATIFISTGLISSGETFWFDRVSQLVMSNPGKEVSVGLDRVRIPQDRGEARLATHCLLRLLKRVTNKLRLATLAEWEKTLGPAAGPSHTAYSRPMTWDQIREMAAEGIEFGSHTVSHPILSRCDDIELEYELTASRDAIARELGQVPASISFPVGGRAAFDSRVIEATRLAGYRIAASYVHGMNLMSSLDRFALKRIHVERYHDASYFPAMVEYPEWFH
jgi:peptidoglycan/xylan/chitin deacetylase (PgdA/CDA1 family)